MDKKLIIDGIETSYFIFDDGRVYNEKTKKWLKRTYKRNEYHTVQLTVEGKVKSYMTHRLVALTFLPNPDNLPVVHHVDGDKYNNKVENLEWVDEKENSMHRFEKQEKRIMPNIDNVQWKPLIGFEDNYLISDNGVIKDIIRERYLNGSLRNDYVRFNLHGTLYSAHRLVYETFIGPIPQGMIIDHINGIKDDNRLENLRCISQSENAQNAQKNGHKGQHKVAQYDINDNFIKEFPSFTAAAKEMGVSYAAISSAAKRGGTSCGYKWKEI